MKLARNILLWISLFFVLCFALVWLLSPWLVRTIAVGSLTNQNVVLDSNSRVRLNLFNSSLRIQTLVLRQNDQITYHLDELQLHYSLWRLFKKEVYIDRVQLRGMQLEVVKQGGELSIAGMDLNSMTTIDKAGEVGDKDENVKASEVNANKAPSLVDAFSFIAPSILLEDISISVTNEGIAHNFLISKLELKRTAFRNKVLGSVVALNANLDGAALGLNADVTVNPEAITLELDFTIKAFNPAVYRYLLSEDVSKLQAAVDVALGVKLTLEGEQLSIKAASLNLDLAKFELQEKTFHVGLEKFNFSVPEFTAQLKLDGSAVQAQADVNLDLTSLEVGFVDSPVILTTLERLVAREMRVSLSDENYKIIGDKLTLEGLMVSKVNDQLPALFTMQAVTLNTLTFSPELVSIDTINLGAGQAYISIDKSGTLKTLVDISALSGVPAETETTVASEVVQSENDPSAITRTEAASGPRIQLRHARLSDPLRIAIQDQSNSNIFNKTFVLTDIEVDEIDSAETEKKTNFKIKLTDEGYFKGELAGWITPFTQKLNLDAQLKMREFSLHEVAPYLKDSLGFEVKAGQLDLDFKGGVKDDEVASRFTILMRGTEFGASQKVDEANLIGQTAIPLNVALGMLKDGDGNIKLKVPVNGDVKDPSFGVHHMLGLVIKKVAMSQAKKQLLNMFLPYAQVVSVALSAGSYALKVRFEDLYYAPGQIEVGETQVQFVEQITALLKDKEGVHVRVCPVAVLADLAEISSGSMTIEQREQLMSIAEQRAQAFKTKLVTEGKIGSARLLLCSPTVDKKKNAVPRLEFGT